MVEGVYRSVVALDCRCFAFVNLILTFCFEITASCLVEDISKEKASFLPQSTSDNIDQVKLAHHSHLLPTL